MQGARAGDSGIYKCKPNNAPEAQIKVHILIGGKYSKLDEPLPHVRLSSRSFQSYHIRISRRIVGNSISWFQLIVICFIVSDNVLCNFKWHNNQSFQNFCASDHLNYVSNRKGLGHVMEKV